MRFPRLKSPRRAWMIRQFQRSRLVQLLASRTYVRQTPDADNYVLRVPPEDYRRNLRALVSKVRAAGAVPILITAPRASRLTPLLVKNRQVARLEDAARLHDDYNEITREVARATKTPLLDLARIFAESEGGGDAWFSDDGIHHAREGRVRIAEEIHRKLVELAGGKTR